MSLVAREESLIVMEEETSTELGIDDNDDGKEFVRRSISNKSNAERAAAVVCAPTPCLDTHWRSAGTPT